VNEDVRHQYLGKKGFIKLERVTNNRQNIRKLLSHRIDMFPMSQIGMNALCQELSLDRSKFIEAFELKELSKGLYMAYSNGTANEIVERTRHGSPSPNLPFNPSIEK